MTAVTDQSPEATESLYNTRTTLRRLLRVRYPLQDGRIVLRTELDWDRNLEPAAVSDDGTFTFEPPGQLRLLGGRRETAVRITTGSNHDGFKSRGFESRQVQITNGSSGRYARGGADRPSCESHDAI